MKRHEDFMRIRVSQNDAIKIFSDVGYNYDECKNMMLYSKILVQFEDEANVLKFEDDDEDINSYFTSSYFDKTDGNRLIIYADNENAYPDICNILSVYDCDIYQFIIEN